MKIKIFTFGIIILLALTSCIKKNTDKIVVEVYPNEIKIDGTLITHQQFSVELKKAIKVRIETGIEHDALFVSLFIDPNTKRGQLADIEVTMRKQNVRKVLYSTMSGKTNAG